MFVKLTPSFLWYTKIPKEQKYKTSVLREFKLAPYIKLPKWWLLMGVRITATITHCWVLTVCWHCFGCTVHLISVISHGILKFIIHILQMSKLRLTKIILSQNQYQKYESRSVKKFYVFGFFWGPQIPAPKLGLFIEPLGFPDGTSGKEPPCQCKRHKRWGFSPWVGKIPWRRTCNPLQYSCLENPKDRGAWQAIVQRVAQTQTWLTQLSAHVRKKDDSGKHPW